MKSKFNDITYSILKGGVGTVPIIGSLAAELFGLIVTPPLEVRRTEWMNNLSLKIKALEEQKSIKLEDLKDNEQFIDVILQATSMALKTSEKIKIDSFRNAVLNTAIGLAPDKTKTQIFLNTLDRFTVWHILILEFIDSPTMWFKNRNKSLPNQLGGSLFRVIIDTFPELKNQDELIDVIWNDLKSAGFHNSGGIKTMMTNEGILGERTTSLGRQFIHFIVFRE
jgi:hypothetical protein